VFRLHALSALGRDDAAVLQDSVTRRFGEAAAAEESELGSRTINGSTEKLSQFLVSDILTSLRTSANGFWDERSDGEPSLVWKLYDMGG
jgi:hypothetical protein